MAPSVRIVLAAACIATGIRAQDSAVSFARDIEPIFRARCVACHGESAQSGGLRLDNPAEAMRGGASGEAIKPGQGADSLLVRMVSRPAAEGPVMPLVGSRLTFAQVALITRWIDEGAIWPARDDRDKAGGASVHWSFVPPRRPPVPQVRDVGWPRNPIDSFVLARLESEGVDPAPEALASTLLRRLSLDVAGLPPTPAELAAYGSGGAGYGRFVERLLASPHYGEMRALHWLDQARFGESDGYQADYIRPFAWRWRHWVIDAYNRNLGFDRFTVEQIAGDLLPGSTVEQRVATGFHRNALHNREGGFPLEMDRVERVVERTSAVATVWLGLSAGCARCHDHKFDPISQKEFYGLYAFFNSAAERDIDAPLPGELGPYLDRRPEFERRRAELFARYKVPELQAHWESRILEAATDPESGLEPIWKILWDLLLFELDGGTDTVRTPVGERSGKQEDRLSGYFVRNVVGGYDFQTPAGYEDIDFAALKKAYARLEAGYPELTQAYTMAASPEPPRTHVLIRGDYRRPGIPVNPAAPSVLHPLPQGEPNRLALARWLVSRGNPLTARVAVNRIWQQFFGTGLVSTPDDFGTRGERPSHPDLLDWLAAEFMASGWDVKHLTRLIVTSATYRQSSAIRPRLLEVDPGNRLLARQSRIRLPAETVRDAALAVAGLVDRRVGGASVRPFLPEGATEIAFGNFVKWPQSAGADSYRRGLYIFRQRTLPYPQLEVFDAPDTVQVACKRDRSTTPLQALTLLNDPVFVEAARGLATRVLKEGGNSVRGRVRHLFRLCLAREPNADETRRLIAYYDQQRGIYTRESGSQLHAARSGKAAVLEEVTWSAVASVFLNLAEFLTRG